MITRGTSDRSWDGRVNHLQGCHRPRPSTLSLGRTKIEHVPICAHQNLVHKHNGYRCADIEQPGEHIESKCFVVQHRRYLFPPAVFNRADKLTCVPKSDYGHTMQGTVSKLPLKVVCLAWLDQLALECAEAVISQTCARVTERLKLCLLCRMSCCNKCVVLQHLSRLCRDVQVSRVRTNRVSRVRGSECKLRDRRWRRACVMPRRQQARCNDREQVLLTARWIESLRCTAPDKRRDVCGTPQ